ncbi:MAG: hypothetical protein HJJLKODD_01095 [Phycisphaerae bacterium]|nr:hypothetical protein [Phycisphaerae bacterium]
MAKDYYTSEEAQRKLGMSADELKQLVRDGQLREFRADGKITYKVKDVDNLAENLATLSGSLGGTTGELILEPSDETSMGLTGSDMLTLEEADKTDDATISGTQKDDTVITSVGISVFDDEDVGEVDPGARTVMSKNKGPGGSSAILDSLSASGTGSGLLDLSRESDDTSLGAELLDEIYSADQEAGIPEMGDATRAGLDAAPLVDRSAGRAAVAEQPAIAAAPVPQYVAAAPVMVIGAMGPMEMALSGALLAAVIIMAFAGIAVVANLQGVVPAFLMSIFQNMPVFGGVFFGIVLVAFGVGFFVGKKGR